MEASGISSGKVIEEELKALSVEQRQFEEEALPRQRFDRPVQIETLEAVSRRQEGVNPAGGDAAPHDGQQAATTFVMGPQVPLPIALLLGAGYARLEMRVERGLEVGDVLRVFSDASGAGLWA